MSVPTLGIIPGTIGAPAEAARVGTLSAYDLSYWASTFVAEGTPSDYTDAGPETDAASLISWAASQVGAELPTDYDSLVATVSQDMTVTEALKVRGALLVCSQRVSLSMGLGDVIDLVDGRYFQYKPVPSPQTPSVCLYTWEYGAYLPGVLY